MKRGKNNRKKIESKKINKPKTEWGINQKKIMIPPELQMYSESNKRNPY